jgi:hypothetical protein
MGKPSERNCSLSLSRSPSAADPDSDPDPDSDSDPGSGLRSHLLIKRRQELRDLCSKHQRFFG